MSGELEPSEGLDQRGELGADPATVDLLAAALRADSSDLEAYHRVLSASVADLLPAGMVEVERDRSLKDRAAGREGRAKSIRVRLGDLTLELRSDRGRLVATSARAVRGVVISRKEITVAEWTRQLAQELAQMASQNADARAALAKLLNAD